MLSWRFEGYVEKIKPGNLVKGQLTFLALLFICFHSAVSSAIVVVILCSGGTKLCLGASITLIIVVQLSRRQLQNEFLGIK